MKYSIIGAALVAVLLLAGCDVFSDKKADTTVINILADMNGDGVFETPVTAGDVDTLTANGINIEVQTASGVNVKITNSEELAKLLN